MMGMSSSASTAFRWALVPCAAVGGLAVGLLLARAGGALLRAVVAESQVEMFFPLDLRVGVLGAAAAFVCVVAASMTAPSAKRLTALLVLAIGAVAAWLLLNPWFFPESHPRAYQLSYLPLTGTYVGGFLGLVVVWLQTSRIAPPAGAAPALTRSVSP